MSPRLRSLSRKQIAICLVLTISLAVLPYAAAVWFRTSRVLRQSGLATALADEIRVSVRSLAERSDARFERFSNAAEFSAAVEYEGALYVCGRSGLYRYTTGGKLDHTWNVGSELPAHPLITLAVRRGIGTPELWIATSGAGVLVFDGRIIRQLLPESPELRKVTALLPLAGGQMLVGTLNAGLYASDGTHLRLFHPQFARVAVTALSGSEDSIWVGTRRDGVWLWRSGEVTRFRNELPDVQVLSLFTHSANTWAGTALGIAEFQGGRFHRQLGSGVFAQALLAQPEKGQSNKLWVGTMDEGVLSLALSAKLPRLSAGRQLESQQLSNAVAFTDFGSQVLGITPSSVIALPGDEPVIETPAATLASGHITALHVDSHNRLWIGYFDRGLDLLNLEHRERALHWEDDRLFCVNRVKEDPVNGTVAVATANGLVLFDRTAHIRQIIDRNAGLISSHVTDVLFRPASVGNSSLVAATPAGISFLDNGVISSVYAFHGLVNNHVYTLAAHDNELMAGTLGGFSLLSGGLVEASFTTANSSLHQNWITASVAVDKDIYLGTYGSGVIRLTGAVKLANYREFRQGRFEINPNAMVATGRAVYAGTAGQGLVIQHRGEERWQFVSEGLPSENVTALEASGGYVYIGTDNGLVRIREQDL